MDRFSVCVGSWKDCNLRKIESSLPNITRKHKTCTLALLFLCVQHPRVINYCCDFSFQIHLFQNAKSSWWASTIDVEWGSPSVWGYSVLYECVFLLPCWSRLRSHRNMWRRHCLPWCVTVYIWYIFNLLSPAPISNCIFSSTFCHVYKMLVGRI